VFTEAQISGTVGTRPELNLPGLAKVKAKGVMEVYIDSDFDGCSQEGVPCAKPGFKAKWTVTPKPAPEGAVAMMAGGNVADTSADDLGSSHLDGLIPVAASLAGIMLITVAAIVGYRIKKHNTSKDAKKHPHEMTSITPQGTAGKMKSKASAVTPRPVSDLPPKDDSLDFIFGEEELVPSQECCTSDDVPAVLTRAWEA